MMDIAETRVVRADGGLLTRILETTHAASPDGLSALAFSQFETAQMRLPWAQTHRRLVALTDGLHVLASARTADLSGTLHGRPVRICAIGAVCADPAHGDIGSARALIGNVRDEARRNGADVAMLFAEDGPPPPAIDGFAVMPLAELELQVIESTRRGAPMTMVRGGDDTDIASIVEMGGTRAAAYPFHLDRDRAFVTYAITRKRLLAGLAPRGTRALEFVVAEEGRSAVAYVVISRVGLAWTVEECGDRDPSGARVGAILQALVARDPAERRPVIRAWLPPSFVPPQVRVVSATPRTSVLIQDLCDDAAPLRLSGDDVLYWKNDVF